MESPMASASSSTRSRSPLPRTPSPGSGSERHWQASGPLAATSRTSAAFASALSHYLEANFLPSVQPQRMEYMEKEATRVRLELLAGRVLPGAKLKPFGSTANGLSLRNSDMDLCCLLPPNDAQAKTAAQLVEELGTVIQQETNFMVKMLPRARIPIIKLVIPASPNSPFGMSCDIGFDNRLALQNTRLLLSYVQLDPRVRPMILFIKFWTKRRKINNPYLGTLSSYGYALLVLSFLMHIRKPAVLPNLQRVRPPPGTQQNLATNSMDGYAAAQTPRMTNSNGLPPSHDVYFFEDVALMKRMFGEPNKDSLGDLLVAFFNYYAHEFRYGFDVVSIQSETGLLTKDEKGWYGGNEAMAEILGGSRDFNRLCIEDPFQRDYNVARTVTKDGLYTIRGEFMRACRAVNSRSDQMATLISELCEEREDEALIIAPPLPSNRRRSAPSPRIPPAQPPPLPTNGPLMVAPIPQSAVDFRQWVEANTSANGMSVDSTGALRNRSAISESGEISPSMPPLPPPRAHFNPRTMPFRHPGGHTYQPVRRPLHHQSASRAPISPPVLERRLSWDGPSPGPQQRDFNRFFQSPSTEVNGTMAHTAPASPLFSTARGQPYRQGGPRSHSHSAMDRRPPPGQSYTNGHSHHPGIVPGSAPSPSIPLPNYISFGNFANNSDGLGLFDAPLDDGDDDDDSLSRTSPSSHVGSNPFILFGDIEVVNKASSVSSSATRGDDDAVSLASGSGFSSRRRSGAVSPVASLPESSAGLSTSSGLPVPSTSSGVSTSMSGPPSSRSSRGSAPPTVGSSTGGKTSGGKAPTLAEHLARLDLSDPAKRR